MWSRHRGANDSLAATDGVGDNYLEFCDRATGSGDEFAAAAAAGIRSVLAGAEKSFFQEYPCQSPTEQLWFAMRVTRFEGSGPVRLVVAHENITERKNAETLATERVALKQAVTAMEQVLGIVGHELRTPLAGLRAISELLLDAEAQVTSEANGFLKSMHEEVVRMNDTVNDLLEAARLNSGQQRWNFNEYHVADICRDAIEMQRPLIDQNRVQMRAIFDPPDAVAIGDGDAICRLVSNLLSNARKHTTHGFIELHARRVRDSGEQWVQISVRDSGKGIPPEIVGRLGIPFALNSGVVGADRASGTGLGLAIVKGTTEAHGGNVHIESAVGQGTTVTVRLRADLSEPTQHEGKIVFSPLHAVA